MRTIKMTKQMRTIEKTKPMRSMDFISKLQKVFVIACALAFMAMPAMAKHVHVKVKKPGQLAERIRKHEKYSITSLKLSGQLNAEDVRVLRDLCGRDTLGHETPGRVTHVDLHDVTFVPGGLPFFYADCNYSVRSAHYLPDCLFDQCRALESVVLPEGTDTIGMYSFAHTALREIRTPDDCIIKSQAFYNCAKLASVEIGRMPRLDFRFPYAFPQCPSIRTVRFHDITYVGARSFQNMPHLEEVTFLGLVGHIDGYVFSGNPKLKSIRFMSDVASTGGKQFVADCPELESVEFHGVVFNTYFGKGVNTPKFDRYTVRGVVLNSGAEEELPTSTAAERAAYKEWKNSLTRAWAWAEKTMQDENLAFARAAWQISESIIDAAREQGYTKEADSFIEARNNIQSDAGLTYLEMLCKTAPYAAETSRTDLPEFKYFNPSDSLLTRTRQYFRTDSIAGNGDDISRIMNLLSWVHDNIQHDGGSSWPDCNFNAVDLYEICQKEQRGLNCRFMAFILNEMLLSVGIPARYLTCQSKHYATDSDCHVINIAWSESLGKWIWVDPTWEAYVTDEHGTLLHPGEVRERLRLGLPLTLNEDANWNHKQQATKESYLENYMAKNLYVISSCTTSQSQPEGPGNNPKTQHITLIPQGFKYQGTSVTTDESYFWQPPY